MKRHATDQAYKEEIGQFYADFAGFEGPADVIQLDTQDQDAIRSGIRNLFEVGGLRDDAFDQDLFATGMDSLPVTNVV